MNPKLPTDDDTNLFFDDVAAKLVSDLGYDEATATALAREYYMSFTNADYCRRIGVAVQDEEFFFHEGVGGVALRIHYYLTLKGDPKPRSYIKWRAANNG